MAATERLLVERGKDVSTREIAEAAGIAEGTIFRVFATKDAIIEAIFADAFDWRPAGKRSGRGRGADLETASSRWFAAAAADPAGDVAVRRGRLPPAQSARHPRASAEPGLRAIADLLRPHAAQLRRGSRRRGAAGHGWCWP
jgi:AcrR family transcriptional regulator